MRGYRGRAGADVMGRATENLAEMDQLTLRHPSRHDLRRTVAASDIETIEPLHVKVWDRGKRLIDQEPIEAPRQRRLADLARLDPGVRRFMNPHIYHVSLTQALWDLKQETVAAAIAE